MQSSSVYIGLENPKSPENVGMVLRAAGCYEANKIFYTGTRYPRASQFFTDTKNSHERIPLVALDHLTDALSLSEHMPANVTLVAVELVEGAEPLMDFVHPQNAYYIFGPEDGSLTKELLNLCKHVVYIPTIGCMNLAATVNVVLYDRLSKSDRSIIDARPIIDNRDVNNKLKM